jgi:aspartyl-tRNA synthetase
MSFVKQRDIQEVIEGLMVHIFKKNMGIDVKTPFRVMGYREAKDKYGSDKPDLRYDLHLTDVSDIVSKSEFGVFTQVVANGGIVKAINPEKNLGRTELDAYIAFAQLQGAKGMAWMRVTEDMKLDSNIAKYFSEELKQQLIDLVKPKPNSILMFIADKKDVCTFVLDKLRRKLAEDLQLCNPKEFDFCWINDFPMFAFNKEDNAWEPEHNPFTMPKPEFVDNFESCPEKALGDIWDLTMNGVELASGAIRVSNPEVQKRILEFIGISSEDAEKKFGFLMNAYKYGGPVHGGMGIGVDRLVAMMLGFADIREVIAFPKNKNAECPMDNSPNDIDDKQWKELGLEITKKK